MTNINNYVPATPSARRANYDESNVIDALYQIFGSGGGGSEIVSIPNGADVALGNTADAEWSQVGAGTLIAISKEICLVNAIIQGNTTVMRAAIGVITDASWSLSGNASLVSITKKLALIANDIDTVTIPAVTAAIGASNTLLSNINDVLVDIDSLTSNIKDLTTTIKDNIFDIDTIQLPAIDGHIVDGNIILNDINVTTLPAITAAVNNLSGGSTLDDINTSVQSLQDTFTASPVKFRNAAVKIAPVLVSAVNRSLLEFNILNPNAVVCYIKFYDKAVSPTVGTDAPLYTLQIPATGSVVITGRDIIVNAGTELWVAATLNMADADATDVTTGLIVQLGIR